MNPTKKLRHLNGKDYGKSYATEEELEKLPKIKKKIGKEEIEIPDTSKLPKETVGNVITNCLARYKTDDRKEMIFVNIAMELFWANENKDLKLKDKIRKFIIKVVENQTLHDVIPDSKEPNKIEEVGSYYAWVTSQVLAELGVDEDSE
jgi:hypothetical protein